MEQRLKILLLAGGRREKLIGFVSLFWHWVYICIAEPLHPFITLVRPLSFQMYTDGHANSGQRNHNQQRPQSELEPAASG